MHHLDALRSFLMIWGILVHASTLAASPVFDTAARISGFVRMEGFFIISGILSLHLLRKYGSDGLVLKRCATLGIPLLVGLLLLNPLTNYVVYCFHNETLSLAAYVTGQTIAHPDGPMVWHLHLWFLFALVAYAIATPRLAAITGWIWERARRYRQRPSPEGLFLLVSSLVVLACFSGRLVFECLIEPFFPESLWFVCRATLHYLPFFGLGMLLGHSPRLLGSFGRFHWLHLALGALLVAGTAVAAPNLPGTVAEGLRLASRTYLGLAMAAALFAVARRLFRREHRWVRRFADASYSIYVLHFLAIYLLATLLRPLLGSGDALILAIVPLTFAVTFAFHHAVVARYAPLRALLNGRIPFRKPSASSQPVGAAAPAKLS